MERLGPGPLLAPDAIDEPNDISVLTDLEYELPPSKGNTKLLNYAINHIFVPPRLPNRADGTPRLEAALLCLVRDLAGAFTSRLEPSGAPRAAWEIISKMLTVSAKLHEDELAENSIDVAIASMEPGDVLPIYVAEQNAAVVFRRPVANPTILTLESFEVSPPAHTVTHAEGKLRITYPSVGRLPAPVDANTRKSLVQFIAYYSQNSMEEAQSKKDTRKQNTQDPPSPRYITELLTGVVRSMLPNPERTYEQTTFITKRINDHALCDKEAGAAWRRSPMWLVIRVALQTTLHDLDMDERFDYKAFMLYIHSSILGFALDFRQPDHLLSVMNAKLACRARKLSSAKVSRKDSFTMDFAVHMNKRVSEELGERWKAIQRNTTRQLDWQMPTQEDLMDAAHLKISQSIPFLAQVKNRDAKMRRRANTKEWTVPGGKEYALRNEPGSGTCTGETVPLTLDKPSSNPLERTIQLYDFEVWVADQLPTADLSRLDLVTLNRALSQYIDVALPHYKGSPERLSVAFLVILELWMTIDRFVVEWQPKLKEFSPEIPTNVLEPLLLPHRSQMERLCRVEGYLELRHRRGRNRSAIFYDTNDQDSFASWFVGQSDTLRDMLQKMEEEAERKTQEKEAEIENLNMRYRTVKQQMDVAFCNKRQGVNDRGKMRIEHSGCPKCPKMKELKRMKFTVFERPLPANKVTLKCVVFELRISQQFAIWRDATSEVLSTCSGGIKEKTDGKPWLISLYPSHMSRFSPSYAGHKLELASYRTKYDSTYRAPVSHKDGIKPHSMSNYRIINQGSWAANPFLSDPEPAFCYLRNLCALEVRPNGPYKSLQFSVSATTHTSNQIIASQDNCSTTITLHDYEAFGHLRAGHKLQWRNMLKELRRGVLSISHEDVHILFLQGMWQAEMKSKTNAWRREAHADTAELAFGLEALEEMSEFLENIEENWTWSHACGMLIVMAARILSLTEEPQVRRAALEFMKRARSVTRRWLREIKDAELQDSERNPNANRTGSAEGTIGKQRQTLLVALVCTSTFNVDEPLIDHVLDPAHDIALLVECRNVIYMNKPPVLTSLPFALRILFDRDELLALRLLPRLSKFLSASPDARSGLDEGIQALWEGYVPDGRWIVYGSPFERWYTTKTAEDGLQGIDVHFNLLDGALYIDHTMFGKLPDAYTQHPTYLRLFASSSVLETRPSTMLGMEHQTKRSVYGWQVHLKMNGNDLVIRCCRDDAVFEFLPRSKLRSALPRALLHDYTHWYNTKTDVIEIRPLSDPWTPNLRKNWSTVFQLNGEVAFSRQQESGLRQFLVDPNHSISRAIHEVFLPLEPNVFDLFISFSHEWSNSHEPQPLTISLPRYNLTFSLTAQGDLRCLSHRDYLVDRTQDVGTLYGLSNMLVLKRPSTASQKRRLILPIGSIRASSDGNAHPNVTIALDPDAISIKYHLYEVDDILGRLLDTTLLSRLYRLYIHSLTAHQLADPLLKCTGTEEAIRALAQGETFSFQTLLPEEIALLQEIGQITPLRHLYSKKTNSMETVQRNTTLPPTSEHYDFAVAVRKIWDYWVSIRVFYPNSHITKEAVEGKSFLPKYEEQAHKTLTRRSAVRNVLYAPTQSPDHNTTASLGKDEIYVARDCIIPQYSSDREVAVFEMSKLTHEWRNGLDVTTRLLDVIKSWDQIPACRRNLSLDYCSVWVDESIESTWRSLYELCRHASKGVDRTKLAFVLATLVYHHHNPEQRRLCTTLLAFATNTIFSQPQHDSPDSGDLDFSNGETPTESRLKSLVMANIVSFKDSPEHAELVQAGEIQLREPAMRFQYETRLHQEINSCMEYMVQQRERPHVPSFAFANFDLLNKSKLLAELNALSEKCSQNRAFYRHLDGLQAELAQIRTPAATILAFTWNRCSTIPPRKHSVHITWSTLFHRNPHCTQSGPATHQLLPYSLAATGTITGSKLGQSYATLLRASGIAYAKHIRKGTTSVDVEAEVSYRTSAVHELMREFMLSIGPRAEDEMMLARSGLWPWISPRSLLEQLTLSRRHLLSAPWKKKLIDFGQAVAMLQRARRLSELSSQEHQAEYESKSSARAIFEGGKP